MAVKAITKEKFIELLNKDLSLEYSAAVQYIQHAAVLTGAAFLDIAKEMVKHANEEIQHAITLSDKIDFIGGIPTGEVGIVKTAKDNVQMIKQDLAGEEDAITRYKARIGQAEQLKEYGIAEEMRKILAVEEEHARDLEQALGK